ncbi:MAG: hypothetical protein JWM68_2073 [Verrucomicrobiales bacterium]|nr:hypothetical protein [Verrucomicrobiales bacterium]
MRLGVDTIRRDLYLLSSHVFGSPALTDIANEDLGAPFSELLQIHEESEIQHLLIDIAARLRILDDEYYRANREPSSNWADNVGSLMVNLANPNQGPLSLREACNKIIHVETLDFWRTRPQEDEPISFPLEPRVSLYGTFNGNRWKAEIDLKRFIFYGYAITQLV